MRKVLKAFTLAELMIVMSIVGIIAAIAVPSLRLGMSEEESVARVRKISTDLQDAYFAMVNIEGEPTSWTTSTAETAAQMSTNFYNKFIKYVDYSTGDSSNCKIFLRSGAVLYISLKSSTDIDTAARDFTTSYYPHEVGNIMVDIDGENKGYNAYGKDMFKFRICDKGIVPEGYSSDGSVSVSSISENNTAWIVKAGNMDYLHCTGLNLNTKLTCD